MSDLRTRLERIGDRVRPDLDAFERLERTRRRRERNRRMEAGVVALVVAAAGSLVAFTAFRDGEPRVGGTVEDGFFALWPEKTYDEALAGQETVDQDLSGELAWRLDPIATAEEFARETLGWGWETPDEDLVDAEVLGDADVAGPGPITVDISTPPFPCPYPPAPGCVRKSATVTLDRLVRPDGVWSVVDVRGDSLDLRVVPGEQVEIGGFVAVPTTLEEGTEVAVGVKGTGTCTGFHEQTAEVLEGHVVLPVEGVGEGCSGYLYALTPPTPVGQVELGKIMFVYGEPKPALGYTIESIAAVPVRFVAPSDDEPPSVEPTPADAARIACDGSDVAIETPIVRAQADGVHVELANVSDRSVDFEIGDMETVGVWSGTVSVGETLTEVLAFAPGTWLVSCAARPDSGQTASAGVGSIEIVDPNGYFVPDLLECGGGEPYSSEGPTESISGEAAAPVEIAEARLTGLDDTDVVEPAGYPGAAMAVVRIVRGGAIVGHLVFVEDSSGWLMATLEGCAGTSYGWESEPIALRYPSGAFEWCPEPPFLKPGPDWSERAPEAAIRFVEAVATGDQAAIEPLLDPSVPHGAWVSMTTGVAEPTVLDTKAGGRPFVDFGCGSEVDAHTVTVTVDDGSNSASLDFEVFLVIRDDGWKVWAVY